MRLSPAILVLSLLASPAFSATYRLELTQEGLGDAGPDWFGTFTTAPEAAYERLTAINLVMDGVTYTQPNDAFLLPPGTFGPRAVLGGIVQSAVPSSVPAPAIFFGAISSQNVYVYRWDLASCIGDESIVICTNAYTSKGTYEVFRDPELVPLPAAGGLALAGLGGLALLRRRR